MLVVQREEDHMLKFEQIRDLDDIPPDMTCLEVFSNCPSSNDLEQAA